MEKYIDKQFFLEDGTCVWCKGFDNTTGLYKCEQEHYYYGGEDGETLVLEIIDIYYTEKALSEMRKADDLLDEFLCY